MADRFFNSPGRALAYYTECQLATLEALQRKARPRPLPAHVTDFVKSVRSALIWMNDQTDMDGKPNLSPNARYVKRWLEQALDHYDSGGVLPSKDAP